MTNTVYTVGQPGEMAEIIDFINYVFSQAHVPHDFKKLLPKVYGDDAPKGQESFHFLAKQDDKIVACIACRPTELLFGDARLNCGFVGSVSVHPYHRGEGHMKALMAMMLEDARAKGYDMLILGGQRQRYGYFGFENAGIRLSFKLTKTNIRHALSAVDAGDIEIRPMQSDDVPRAYELWARRKVRASRTCERFFAELKSWKQTPLTLFVSGKNAGYLAGRELVLADEALLPGTIKALMENQSESDRSFFAAPHEKQRISFLKDICESVSLDDVEMVNVLNWPKVLDTLIGFKHRFVLPVSDCACSLDIEGDGAFALSVKDGCAEVKALASAGSGAIPLSHLEAQRLFFGIAEMYTDGKGIDASCRGLPFWMSEQDAF